MKKSKLTLTAIALTAMVISITACGGSKPSGESATVAVDPQQELDAKLAAAATPTEKAEIYAVAIAEAKAKAEAQKAVVNAAEEKLAKAPGMAKKALQGTLDKEKEKAAAAESRVADLIAQAAAAAATPVAEAVAEAVVEAVSPESAPAE